MRPPRAASLTRKLVLATVFLGCASPCVALAAGLDHSKGIVGVLERPGVASSVGAPTARATSEPRQDPIGPPGGPPGGPPIGPPPGGPPIGSPGIGAPADEGTLHGRRSLDSHVVTAHPLAHPRPARGVGSVPSHGKSLVAPIPVKASVGSVAKAVRSLTTTTAASVPVSLAPAASAPSEPSTVSPAGDPSTVSPAGEPSAANPTSDPPTAFVAPMSRRPPAGHEKRRAVPKHSHRGAARTVGSTARAGVAAAGVVAAPLLSSGRAGRADTSTKPQRRARHRAQAQATSSQVVTTITRIVGVVPTAIWALLGVLAALALGLALRARLVAMRARRLERQRTELLEDVGLLQTALLPVAPARLGPVGTSAAYRPADGPGAGGDFYDMFALEDGKLGVILGDLSGHGRQALPHTALVRFTLRAYLEAGLSPRKALRTAGTVLDRQLGGSFVTVVVATYQPRTRTLTYAAAGHPPPVVLDSDRAPVIVCSAPPIGTGMRTGTRQTVMSVPGRSEICFYTDGLTEARVGSDLYGAERLLATLHELGPNATAAEVLDRVAAQTTRRPDDMAVCVLNVAGGALRPAVVLEELELDREEATSDRVERFLLACGLSPEQIPELIGAAQLAAGEHGTVLLQVRAGAGGPEVTLLRDNIASLDEAHARRSGLGATG